MIAFMIKWHFYSFQFWNVSVTVRSQTTHDCPKLFMAITVSNRSKPPNQIKSNQNQIARNNHHGRFGTERITEQINSVFFNKQIEPRSVRRWFTTRSRRVNSLNNNHSYLLILLIVLNRLIFFSELPNKEPRIAWFCSCKSLKSDSSRIERVRCFSFLNFSAR